jgi:hypothetical protein
MRRLVIALTTLLTLVGVSVVAGYLFVFGPTVDKAATMAPANALAYVTVYLSPSTGQETSLADLLTRLPGFSDRSALGDKIDELVQQALSSTGVDYHADVKPWLGDQLAVALLPGTGAQGIGGGVPVVLVGVRDEPAAEAAVHRIAESGGGTLSTESQGGVTVDVLAGGSSIASRVAILDGMLVATDDASALQAVIDTAQGKADRLADVDSFRGAMRTLPSDRLASIYLDISGAAASAGQLLGTGGYGAAGLAIVAKQDGLQLVGSAPFDPAMADASTKASYALASEPSSLPDWMPADTEAELVFFGAQQAFSAITAQLGSVPGGQDLAQALTQLRALAALGLGIDLDRDLLPLFDREAALAITGLSGSTPHGVLLLRPSDVTAAADALQRMADALRARDAGVTHQEQAGTTVTIMTIPQVGQVAYAISGGVVLAGLSADDVAAALLAHQSGETLGASAGYRAAFDVAGGRGGNELYLDGSRATDSILGLLGQPTDSLPADIRDMLSHVDAVAITVPSGENEIRIHATVTVH